MRSRQERISQRIDGDVVQQRRERLLLPLPCGLPYGKKHEIELPDGRCVTKMAGPNLKVIVPAQGLVAAWPHD